MTSSQNNQNFLDGEEVLTLIRATVAEGRTIRSLPFRGISMLPMLRQGKDTVELAPLPEHLQKYDLPVYQYPSGKVVMHRIVGEKDGCYICCGDNLLRLEKIPPEWMIAVVTAFTRDGKRIEVTDPGYCLYSRVWVALRPLRYLWKLPRHIAGRLKRKIFR